MSRISPQRHGMAATITAVLAFMILVPTVLHVAIPAFGQGTGSGSGYSAVVEVGSDTQLDVTTPVGSVSAGQNVTVTFQLPAPSIPLEPTSLSGADREEFLQAVLQNPSVSQVLIRAGASGSSVSVQVRELLPNDPNQTAIPVLPGTSVAGIVLKVKALPTDTGATEAASVQQEYRALKLLQITTPGLEKGGVEGATISFRLTDQELEAMGVTLDTIALLHHVGGEWEPLPTRLVSSEGGIHMFEAETPSFSYFAIASKEPSQETVAAAGGSLLKTGLVLVALVAIVVAAAVVLKKRQNK